MATLFKDGDVRRAVYARMLGSAMRSADTLVIDELGLDHGSCRIDIAVINGHIRGLEIKAEADTLAAFRSKSALMAKSSIRPLSSWPNVTSTRLGSSCPTGGGSC